MLCALVVARDVVLRRVIMRPLGARMAVDGAGRLDQAIERLRAARYDIVIVEDRLPDGGGCALLARIRDMDARCRCALMSAVGPIDPEGDMYERFFFMPRDLTAFVLWIDVLRSRPMSSTQPCFAEPFELRDARV